MGGQPPGDASPGTMTTGYATDVKVDLLISGEGGQAAADELRSLLDWLDNEDELRGRARLVATPPQPGQMGAGIESLLVALAPGGLVTVFAAVVTTWIRSRSGSVSIELSRPDGLKLRFEAKNARALPPERVDELAHQVAGLLTDAGPGAGELPPGIPEG